MAGFVGRRNGWVAAGVLCVTVGCATGATEPSAGLTSAGPTSGTGLGGASSAGASSSPSAAPPTLAACDLKTKALVYAGWTSSARVFFTGGPTGVEQGDDPEKTIDDGSIDAWDLAKGERVFTLNLGTPMSGPPYVDVSPDGRSAVAVDTTHYTRANPIAMWNLESGTTSFAGARIRYPEGIDISHNGKLAIADGGGSNAVVVELPTLKVVKEVLNDTAASGSMVFSKDDAALVNDWQFGMSLDDPRSLRTKKQWSPAVGSLSPDRSALAIASKKFWGVVDASTGKTLVSFEDRPKLSEGPPVYVRYAPDGKRVAVYHTDDNGVTVWSAETGKKVGSAKLRDQNAPAWSTDGAVLLCGSEAFDAATMKPLPDVPGEVLASFAGHLLLVGEPAKAEEIDVSTGKKTGRTFELTGLAQGSIAMSADRAYLAYARKDTGSVRIIRVSDQETLDLAVAWKQKSQIGYAWSSEGSFDGPDPAAGCAAKASGRATKASPGLVRAFFSK